MPSRLRRSRDTDRSRSKRDEYNAAKQSVEVMPFGEHKGKPFNKLPSTYLEWALVALWESPVIDRLTDELIRRKGQ